jgi:undecaprenyl pyrophosphate synthase
MEELTIEKLIEENKFLKEKINELTQHLKKYTAPQRNKKFYENHKEEIIKKVMEYKEKNKDKKQDPEKIKEYNRRAYLKRKEEKNNN